MICGDVFATNSRPRVRTGSRTKEAVEARSGLSRDARWWAAPSSGRCLLPTKILQVLHELPGRLVCNEVVELRRVREEQLRLPLCFRLCCRVTVSRKTFSKWNT